MSAKKLKKAAKKAAKQQKKTKKAKQGQPKVAGEKKAKKAKKAKKVNNGKAKKGVNSKRMQAFHLNGLEKEKIGFFKGAMVKGVVSFCTFVNEKIYLLLKV